MSMCRFTRLINSSQLSRCPLKGHVLDRPATGRLKCHFSFAQHVVFLISIKGFIFEAAVLEDAVADSLQFSFHESLQVICFGYCFLCIFGHIHSWRFDGYPPLDRLHKI